jgi:hypothetical protein
MATSVKKHWYSEHRSWEGYLSAGLGVLAVLSPTVLAEHATTAMIVNGGAVGVLIVALAVLELMSLERWEELLEMACGVWIVVLPFLFGYGGALRTVHVVLGAAVAVLAVIELWQDRGRRLAR